ncbi:GNAT family N-acetyltransferase, partial [Streptomyces sp. NRRL S-1896]
MYPVNRSSSRLKLRELAHDDVDAVLAIYGSPAATEHLSFEPRSREQVEQIVSRSVASAAESPRTEYALAVVQRDTNDLIGFGRIATDPHQPRGATFGFALRPDTWGAGLGLESVQLLLGVGFEELELHRIWGARSPHNKASAKTLTAA